MAQKTPGLLEVMILATLRIYKNGLTKDRLACIVDGKFGWKEDITSTLKTLQFWKCVESRKGEGKEFLYSITKEGEERLDGVITMFRRLGKYV